MGFTSGIDSLVGPLIYCAFCSLRSVRMTRLHPCIFEEDLLEFSFRSSYNLAGFAFVHNVRHVQNNCALAFVCQQGFDVFQPFVQDSSMRLESDIFMLSFEISFSLVFV